jgi:hypothetical protein
MQKSYAIVVPVLEALGGGYNEKNSFFPPKDHESSSLVEKKLFFRYHQRFGTFSPPSHFAAIIFDF